MRALSFLILLSLPAGAAADPERITNGLQAPDRASREEAARAARAWARTDPAGVAALLPALDLRGKAELLRALAGAGTSHAARLALRHADAKEEVLFSAIVAGLREGGEKAILAELPDGVMPEAPRRLALERLRMRWKVEERFAALKSRSGRTGHYDGQYEHLKPFGEGAVEVMWAIVRDRSWPLPGDAGSEPYVPLHPGMRDFEAGEMRTLAAYAFGELVAKDDMTWKRRLMELFHRYWNLDEDLYPMERGEIAPALAFSLHDLDVTWPAKQYIAHLEDLADGGWGVSQFDRLGAMWDLGYAHMRIGNPAAGEQWYARVIREQEDWGRGVAAYNLACHFAVRAAREPKRAEYFKEQALAWLSQAIEVSNFIDWVWMEEDGDLNAIRDEPGYKRLRDHLQERYPGRKRHRVEKSREKFLKPPK